MNKPNITLYKTDMFYNKESKSEYYIKYYLDELYSIHILILTG